MNLPIALQLWSVKDEMQTDFAGTLKKVAEMGYDGVEFAGYGGLTANEIKTLLNELGLKVAGSHIGIDLIKNNLDEVIEFEKAIGNQYVVCPYAEVDTKEKLDELIALFKIAGEKLAKEGLTLLYHNHAHEFIKYDNKYALDILFSEVPEKHLQAEVDTYWVQMADEEPIGYVKSYQGKMPLIHLKDMLPNKGASTEIGNGIMDIAGLVRVAKEIGTKWLVIEQEEYTRPSIECVEIGLTNLKKIEKEN